MATDKSEFAKRVVPELRLVLKDKFQEMFGSSFNKDLPEYVIVVLSNRRTREYVVSQFTAILGEKRTVLFADWLFTKINQIENGVATESIEAGPSAVVVETQSYHLKENAAPAPSSREQEKKVSSRSHDVERRRSDDRSRHGREERDNRGERERRDPERRDRDRDERSRRARETRSRRDSLSHRDRNHRERRKSQSAERKEVDYSGMWEESSHERTPPRKIASEIVVKRKVTDSKTAKGGSSMFLRAMNAATTTLKSAVERKRRVDDDEDMEVAVKEEVPQKRRSLASRISHRKIDDADGHFMVTVGSRTGGPAVQVLSDDDDEDCSFEKVIRAGETRKIAEIKRIVSGEANNNAAKAKQKPETGFSTLMERKPLRERLSRADGSRYEVVHQKKESSSESTTPGWDCQIKLESESEDEDEMVIDAMLVDGSKDEDDNPSPPSQLEDHMQPEERAFFVQAAMNVHLNPSHPSFVNKDGNAVQNAIQAAAASATSCFSKASFGVPSKIQTRCKFWPNCNLPDEQCPFAHPTVACSKFPHCRFGDRCLYVHPLCRYGKLCRNSYCGYSHPTKTCNLTYMKPSVPESVTTS